LLISVAIQRVARGFVVRERIHARKPCGRGNRDCAADSAWAAVICEASRAQRLHCVADRVQVVELRDAE
jgi:hypothetical protein